MIDLSTALPLAASEITLTVGALVLLVAGAFSGDRSARGVSIAAVALLVSGAAIAATGPLGTAFNGAFVADPLAVYGKVAIYLTAAVAVVLGGGWMQRERIAKIEYPILIVLASVGMSMMASSGDLISMYVGIELHSLALYVLAAYHRDDLKIIILAGSDFERDKLPERWRYHAQVGGRNRLYEHILLAGFASKAEAPVDEEQEGISEDEIPFEEGNDDEDDDTHATDADDEGL